MRLAYHAPDDCPDETAFVEAVKSQAHPFERAPRSAARVRLLEAEIAHHDGGHAGVLHVREAGGQTSEREVHGATCGEVFSALSLVTALAIDTGPPPPSPPPPDEITPPEPVITPRWTVATSLLGGAFFSMAPNPAFGVAPEVEASPPLARAFDVRLGLVFAASPRADTAAGSAEFYWLAGRLAVTPVSITRDWFTAGFTLGVDGGAVLGRGVAIWLGRQQWRPWLDVAIGLRARAAIASSFGLELAGGILVPITRDTWIFDRPDTVIHETPPLGGFLTAGIRFDWRR